MSKEVAAREMKDPREWETLYLAVAKPNLMQSFAYGEAKRASGGWRPVRLVFEQAGEPVAICQVLERRCIGYRWLSRINRGPLFLDANPDVETRHAVLHALRQRWRWLRRGALIVAPALDDLQQAEQNRALLRRLGFIDLKRKGWCSAMVDLQRDEDQMLASLAPKWRNSLRSSLRAGLELESSRSAEHVEWILDRHAANMQAKQFKGPSRQLLNALHRANPDAFTILRARHGGTPVAGMVLVRFGNSAEYYIGWFGEAGRKFNAGNFMCWNAMLEMKRAGCRWFDLGGYGDTADKYGRFKRGVRGDEYRFVGEWLAW
jgi:lipid II:glycine glycyltransferase (peptidoglycan interpeptide bridge formation enzyme)